jgi:predicted dehydrogenase
MSHKTVITMSKKNSSRRKFLQQLSGSALALGASPFASLANEEKMEERILRYEKPISSNDAVRIAVIGAGIMGNANVETALKIPGVEIVGACDLYTGRLERMKELYGANLFTTRDYRQVLDRKDVDAVIIATSDHWHARIATEAMQKGKHVYCEKPMVHRISEGMGVVNAQKQTKKVMQVGSQRVSSITHAKARELYRAGQIGQLTCIEATYDRQSANGAWEYTMPTDGNTQTVDWDRYIAGMPKEPYDPKKFFWWRNYRAFGTGVAGDLFVHLLSGVHVITDSFGPERIFSSGQLAYWKDGRDVPDVMTAIMDYPATKNHPAFQLTLRVNFISGDGGKSTTRFFGSEGVIDMGWNGFTISHSLMSKAPGIGGWDSLSTYPKDMQEELKKQYNQRWSAEDQKRPTKEPIKYAPPQDYNENLDHWMNFIEGVRSGKPVNEGPEFGFRAAAPCLAANDSYFQKKIINWDPVNMKLK